MKVTVLFPIIDSRPLLLDKLSEDFTRDFWIYFQMYDTELKSRKNGAGNGTWQLLKRLHKRFRLTKKSLAFPELQLIQKQTGAIGLQHDASWLYLDKSHYESPKAWFEIVFSNKYPTSIEKEHFSAAIDRTIDCLLKQPARTRDTEATNFLSVGSILAKYYAKGTNDTGEEHVVPGYPTVIIEIWENEYYKLGESLPIVINNPSQREKVRVRHRRQTFVTGTGECSFDVNIWALKNVDKHQKTSFNLCQTLSNLHFHYISYRRILSRYAFYACSLKRHILKQYKEQSTRNYFAYKTPLLSEKARLFVEKLSNTSFNESEKKGIAKVEQAIQKGKNVLSLLRSTIEKYIDALDLRRHFDYQCDRFYIVVVAILLLLSLLPVLDIMFLPNEIFDNVREIVYPSLIVSLLILIITPYFRK